MSSNGPNLWWVYDTENQSFGSLPTGPFFLPAIVIMAISAILGDTLFKPKTLVGVHEKVASDEWKAKHARYQHLVDAFVCNNGDLSLAEQYELDQLKIYLNNPYGYATRKH
jgi:hypothetical protein